MIPLTPEQIRFIARHVGGCTNGQASDIQDCIERIMDGTPVDVAIEQIRQENEE